MVDFKMAKCEDCGVVIHMPDDLPLLPRYACGEEHYVCPPCERKYEWASLPVHKRPCPGRRP